MHLQKHAPETDGLESQSAKATKTIDPRSAKRDTPHASSARTTASKPQGWPPMPVAPNKQLRTPSPMPLKGLRRSRHNSRDLQCHSRWQRWAGQPQQRGEERDQDNMDEGPAPALNARRDQFGRPRPHPPHRVGTSTTGVVSKTNGAEDTLKVVRICTIVPCSGPARSNVVPSGARAVQEGHAGARAASHWEALGMQSISCIRDLSAHIRAKEAPLRENP